MSQGLLNPKNCALTHTDKHKSEIRGHFFWGYQNLLRVNLVADDRSLVGFRMPLLSLSFHFNLVPRDVIKVILSMEICKGNNKGGQYMKTNCVLKTSYLGVASSVSSN